MAELNVDGIAVVGPMRPGFDEILTRDALAFVRDLHRKFNPVREELLARRAERQVLLDEGKVPSFREETADIRRSHYQVAPPPPDLLDRRVEITGPCDAKMMINALNSGARVFMADLEDALAPSWDNVVIGQLNLKAAVRSSLTFDGPDGKSYRLGERVATLLVRPRGFHLHEKHVKVDGAPISASLFDFGLYFFHNVHERLARGTAPYFYLPKLESHVEARLWNDVFVQAQATLGVPRGSIRATVLIETILAAFEMDEILYELRDHAAGLNAGRWDYIFSIIKKFRNRSDKMLPDRGQVSMTVPFMRAYTELLVKTCHQRGAHAIGGMAAYIPSRRDAEVNDRALAKVREDKVREAGDGFDGTWVAHPDLVPTALEAFDHVLRERPHQKERLREDVVADPAALVDTTIPGGTISVEGLAHNVSVALRYMASWLSGTGAAAIDNLMEDAATAEISRSQIWQWIRHGAKLVDGGIVDEALYRRVRDEQLARLVGLDPVKRRDASTILDRLVLDPTFTEFLTLRAYEYLD